MASALEKMEQRCKLLEEKYDKVKNLKKIFKNCTAMQCAGCGKWVQSVSFSQHIEQCGDNSLFIAEKSQSDMFNKQSMHISVSQSVCKDIMEKKPYFEYIIQTIYNDKKYKATKQYKQFTELSQVKIF